MKTQKIRQKIRKTILFIFFLLFPVLLNYLSPYVIIHGAIMGIVTGSALLFIMLFFSSLFLGRIFCSWICPGGGLQEACFIINKNRVNSKNIDWIKYIIWAIWLLTIIIFFILAGGIAEIDPLYLTKSGVSVDKVSKFIVYYFVVGLIFLFSMLIGKRTMCHTICWMAPFMILGRKLRNLFHLPALQLKAKKELCINCNSCTDNCPMSLDVNTMVQHEKMENTECILCGQCVDICKQNTIKYSFGLNKKGKIWKLLFLY